MCAQFSYSTGYSKLWGAATYFGHYNELLYTIEPQIRLIDRQKKYDQSLLNAGMGIKVRSPFQIWLGQTYVNYASANDVAEDVGTVVQNEYRIWEQLMWRKPFSAGLASRTRIEQRRAFETSEWAVRFRERAYWTIPCNETFSFVLSDEFFLNLKSVPWVTTSTLDQNRIFIGFFYQLTPNLGLNVSYMNQSINRRPTEYNNGIVLNLIMYSF